MNVNRFQFKPIDFPFDFDFDFDSASVSVSFNKTFFTKRRTKLSDSPIIY